MFDFLTAALAVPELSVGDTRFNTERIIEKIDEADGSTAEILCFPELAVTGYTCGDLFGQTALLEEAEASLAAVCKKSAEVPFVIVLGLPLRIGTGLYNCAAVIYAGRVCGIVPKSYLPDSGAFSEKRHFSSAFDLKIKSVTEKELSLSDCEREIPVGNDLIFDLGKKIRLGVEICEDLWAPVPQSTVLALAGANLIVNLSASPEIAKKRGLRTELVRSQSAKTHSAYVFVSAGMTESTTDLIFSGHGIMCENGRIIAENENYIDSDYLLFADADMGAIMADRLSDNTFGDCAARYSQGTCRTVSLSSYRGASLAEYRKVRRLPFIPDEKTERESRCREIFEMQVCALKKRLEITHCKPVVGVSGGLDSTLALLVSAETVRRMGRSASEVVAITMPCFGTSDRTHSNSWRLMEALGVTAKEISIKKACLRHFEDIGHPADKYDLTFENSQARERTQVLMDYAGKIGGLVIGTGDLSELALGWCTYNADHMSMYCVNGGIPKTLMRHVVRSCADSEKFSGCREVLLDVLDTPISPELLPPDETGKIAQQTEELVGPYALHDFFIFYALRYGFTPEKIYFLAKKAFSGMFGDETILKWLKNFYRRFFTQQFKRSCMPDGVKVGAVGLSPRGDLKMPSDASARIWLDRAERL